MKITAYDIATQDELEEKLTTKADVTHSHNWINKSSSLKSISGATQTLYVNEQLRLANYTFSKSYSSQTANNTYAQGTGVIPSGYRPLKTIYQIWGASDSLGIMSNGNVDLVAHISRSSTFTVAFNMLWRF